jgi:chromosome segregation ATPase
MSRIEEILILERRLKEELESHLRQKANLSTEINKLSKSEKSLIDQIKDYNERLNTTKEPSSSKSETAQLLEVKTKLEEDLKIIQSEINNLEQQLTQYKTDLSLVDSKIQKLEQDKLDKERMILAEKQKYARSKRAKAKIKNTREKVKKVKTQLTQQETIKRNLESFFKTLNDIHQVVSDYSPLSEKQSKKSQVISTDFQEKIIRSKKLFDQAQMKFSANDVTPFLIDAQEAYEQIISVFIELCPELPTSLLEQDFSSQIFSIVNKGLTLNTRHLNAVQTMLKKLEKGVEIAPLASFANEVKQYFVENLTYLRITGWILPNE